MNKSTLVALKGSIAKWQAIAKGTGIDRGMDNCPLCQKFYTLERAHVEEGCNSCPVFKKTGLQGCGGTPYDDWVSNPSVFGRATTPKFKKIARDEVKFLKSLLPKEKK